MTDVPPWRKGQKVKAHNESTPKRSNSPAPADAEGRRERVYRRKYLVERLPPKVQSRVFDMYARGVPYRTMSARLAKQGYRIHHAALSRYWRQVWHKEHERLMEARGLLAVLKQAFQLDPKSTSASFAEELLYTVLVQQIKVLEKKDPKELLEQARAQQKPEGGKKPKGGKREEKSAAAEAKEVRRRWRELYGMNEDAEEENKQE